MAGGGGRTSVVETGGTTTVGGGVGITTEVVFSNLVEVIRVVEGVTVEVGVTMTVVSGETVVSMAAVVVVLSGGHEVRVTVLTPAWVVTTVVSPPVLSPALMWKGWEYWKISGLLSNLKTRP